MTPEQRETLGKALEYSKSYVEGFAADAAWVMAHGSADAPAILATKAFHHARLAEALRAALAPPPTCGTCKHDGRCGIQAVCVSSQFLNKRATGCIGAYEPTEPTR